MDNREIVKEIKRLSKKIECLEKKIGEMKPYIDTLEDIKSAGRIFAWITGAVVTLLTAYLTIKQVFFPK